MEKFKINLLNQHSKIEAHHRNLSRFMNDERFNRISLKEQILIRKQIESLAALNDVIRERLRLHGIDC